MRLIDADAEIAKIEQEIQRINEKIKRLENRMLEEPNNSIHVFSEQIKQCHRNIANCKKEIRVLQQYQTAYDVDKVVEQIRKMEICGSCLNNQNPIPVCATFCDVGKKLEIVKAGEINEKEN